MGLSPIGSNRKPRSSLIFRSKSDLSLYKGITGDLADARGTSATETVLQVLLGEVATTRKARDIARSMYAADAPTCREAYDLLFQELSAVGERGRDARPLVESFLDYSLRLGLRIDTAGERIHHLLEQWDSICSYLEREASEGDPDTMIAASNARELERILTYGVGSEPYFSHINLILAQWDSLHGESRTYRCLIDLNEMALVTRQGAVETAEDRLALLRLADAYYLGGREAETLP